MSVREYLDREREAATKHEFFGGRLIEVAGGTPNHNRIATDAQTVLANALRDAGCEVFNSDQRVRAAAGGPFFYPDVSVVCGPADFDADFCLVNPLLLVEILSASTAAFDRDEKFRAYRRIASLRHFLLVASEEVRVEHYERLPGGVWALVGEYEDREVALALTDPEVTLPLAEIYRRVRFEEPS